MFFVKITTIDNVDFVINLERVTLLGRTSRIVDGSTKNFTAVNYDLGEGTVTTFTIDCTLEQFHDFMEHFFSCTTATGPSLKEFLQPPTPVKKSDIEPLVRGQILTIPILDGRKAGKLLNQFTKQFEEIPYPPELDDYDASPRNPLSISGIRRKTQPTASQEVLKELLNEPPQPTPQEPGS